jgi:hypothetical protein
VLTELIPLALVVALSPLSIIPAVLVLHTPRPTGLAFLAGRLLGLPALTAIFLEVSNLLGGLGDAEHDQQRSAPRDWEPFRYSRARCRVIASTSRCGG